jgi:O-antigen/teichoic acid export membrane protein
LTSPASISLWRRLFAAGRGDGLRAQLLRGGAGSVGLKLIHTALTVLIAVVLARTLGPDGYGVYAFVYALINVLALPATMGLPQLLVRETAKAKSRGDWGLMRGLWRWSSLATLVFALVIAGGVLLVLAGFGDRMSDARVNTLLAGLVMVPLIALVRLRDGALRGLGHVVLGQLAENAIRPGLFILLLVAVALGSGLVLDATGAMALHVTAAGVAFIVGASLLQICRPRGVRERPALSYHSRAWLSAAMPLALIAGFNLLNQWADVLILGIFRPDSEVGLYRVAAQGAMIIGIGVQAVSAALQPKIVELNDQAELQKLQALILLAARSIFAIGFVLFALYLLVGQLMLTFIFGSDFLSAYHPLLILSLGQLSGCLLGSVGSALVMLGYEKDTFFVIAFSAAINLLLNILLIPYFGADGAAWATALSLLVRGLAIYFATYWRTGIRNSVI